MNADYTEQDYLADTRDEALLDLLARYRTVLEELEKDGSSESERERRAVKQAIRIVEAEIVRRKLGAQA